MKKTDVGILGYWYATNYGSALTYYALDYAIKKIGFSTMIIDCPEKWNDPEGEDVFPRRFLKKHCIISDSLDWDKIGEINNYCDTFVIGSDQVWTTSATRGMRYLFYLNFINKEKRKVAYAPSFGSASFEPDEEMKNKIDDLICQFDAISVREDSGKTLLWDKFGIEAEHVLDPVFLMDNEEYDEYKSASSCYRKVNIKPKGIKKKLMFLSAKMKYMRHIGK